MMTQRQALSIARKRWGRAAFAKRGSYHGLDPETRRARWDPTRCAVGYVIRGSFCDGIWVEGSGDTWEEAFAAADASRPG